MGRSNDTELAAFCEQLPRLRRTAQQRRLAGVLKEVLAQARAGAPVSGLLSRLGISGGIDERRQGTGDAPINGDINVSDLRVGRSLDEGDVCPAEMGARHAEREPGGLIPLCWVHGQQMRLVTASLIAGVLGNPTRSTSANWHAGSTKIGSHPGWSASQRAGADAVRSPGRCLHGWACRAGDGQPAGKRLTSRSPTHGLPDLCHACPTSSARSTRL